MSESETNDVQSIRADAPPAREHLGPVWTIATVYAVEVEKDTTPRGSLVAGARGDALRWTVVARYRSRGFAEQRLANEKSVFLRTRVRGTSRSTTRPAGKRLVVETYLVADGKWFRLPEASETPVFEG